MFYNATNGRVDFVDTDMYYIAFGNGDKNLIIIPGLGDGLKTVKGTAILFAFMYRIFAKDYRVYVFSRKNKLTEGYSTRDMARDIKLAMDKLSIDKVDVMGVSQGGMIAQYVAIDYPEAVNKLVLAVTLSKQNDTVQKVVKDWLEFAKSGDYKSLFIDTAEKMYTEKYLKRYRPFYPILTSVGKPRSFERFIIMANACITHNAYDELEKIKAPTFVVGGDSDKVVGDYTSEEIAEKISGSKLHIYKNLGHSAYEEAKDFNGLVLNFLSS